MLKTILMFVVIFLAGCASVFSDSVETPDEEILQRALSGIPILEREYRPEELPDLPLFELTPEMKAFAKEHTAGISNAFDKAQALHSALLQSPATGGRGITYSAMHTLTGAETFAQRQANCLSFTLLYVSLAQEVGLDAHVNEVELPPTWDIRNSEAFLFFRHVNTKVLLRSGAVVIDLEMDRYNPDYKQHLITKDLAAAQYYSNRGMDFSALGDPVKAFLHLRKALMLDAQQSYIWNNIASLYRRQGFLPESEALYLQGLRVNSSDLSIISNLSGLYKLMGDSEKSEVFFQRAEKHRQSNPYYMYYMATRALANDNPLEAEALLKKSLRKEKKEPRFYELGIKIYEALGDPIRAQVMRDRLERQHKER